MDNPYRKIRELTFLNQKDFARKYDFSRTFMTFIESGQLPDLSTDAVNALFEEAKARGIDYVGVLNESYNGQSLNDAYHTWQATERMRVASQFQSIIPQQGTIMPFRSPFVIFINDVTGSGSAQKFCKILKVPSTAVTRYSRGITSLMPKVIKDALIGIRYPYLEQLETLQFEWVTSK